MKALKLNTLLFALAGLIMFGCSNQEMESRIAKLEGKVAKLEGKTSNPNVKPTAAKTAEPEVMPEGPLPEFKFDEDSYDFGNINEGDVVDHTFTFTNVGQAPLVISSATGSCGCTIPEWPKESIAPGETGEIKVQFNSKGKGGVNNKTVSITANTYPKLTKLKISALVAKKDQNPS